MAHLATVVEAMESMVSLKVASAATNVTEMMSRTVVELMQIVSTFMGWVSLTSNFTLNLKYLLDNIYSRNFVRKKYLR